MAGRPSKPTDLILLEGKSHRTKAELEQRKQAEQALTTGKHMQIWPEVKANPAARKEFNRVRALLKKIGKDDALHEGTINRYALLKAECAEFEEKRESFYDSKIDLEKEYRQQKPILDPETGRLEYELKPSTYYKLLSEMQKSIIALDKQIMAKRQMLLAIEKENIMTIASVMRSIPKKPTEKTPSAGGMAGFMARRGGGGSG